MPKEQTIPLFSGVVASVDPSLLKPHQASQAPNARFDTGRLTARYGYKNLQSAQANFVALWGLHYCHGWNSSNAEVEEYVSFENISASVNAYSRNASTGSPTGITGATGLNASEWTAVNFNDTAYFMPGAGSTRLYKHLIGDATSWVAILAPAGPTTALTYSLIFKNDGTAGGYSQLSWAGTDAADVAVTGGATTTNLAVSSTGELTIQCTDGNLDNSITVDLNAITASIQDWTYNDGFAFQITEVNNSQYRIDASTVRFALINNDGSPITIYPTETKAIRTSTNTVAVWVRFDNKTRADWDNVRKVVIAWVNTAASSVVTNNKLTFGKIFVGCCFPARGAQTERLPDANHMRFAYSYYYSTPNLESEIAGEVDVSLLSMDGYDPLNASLGQGMSLGVFVKFTFTTSADTNVDNNRLYWFGPTGKFKRIVTQTDGTTTYTLKMSYAELLALTDYSAGGFVGSNLSSAFAFKGSVVWLYDQGDSNVKVSRIGEPLRQASDLDEADDENRGATFTLADNASDTPLGGCQSGDSALIAAKNGVHEMVGDRPSNLTPPKRLPGSFGVAGKFAFARWKDDFGNPGMAFVDVHGTGVYFAIPSGVQNIDAEGKVIELSDGLRGFFREYLLTGQLALGLTDFSTCRVFVDEAEDALWIIMGKRFFKFTRPDIVTGKRQWQHGEFNTGTTTAVWQYFAPSTKRRLRGMRSDGKFDELEWNSAAGVWITGANRDGGYPMPPGFWRSGAFLGPNRRVQHVYLKRSRVWEVAKVRIHSRRATQVYRVGENRQWTKCLPIQQGEEHAFEIQIDERDVEYEDLRWTEIPLSPGRHR